MRKIISSIIILFFILFSVTNATPGRTNSSGYHNSKTAGYHCHNSGYTPSYNYSDYKAVNSLCSKIKKEGVFTIDEIKERTCNYSNCIKIRKYTSVKPSILRFN